MSTFVFSVFLIYITLSIGCLLSAISSNLNFIKYLNVCNIGSIKNKITTLIDFNHVFFLIFLSCDKKINKNIKIQIFTKMFNDY
jgi:hypothetical protein